MLRVRWQQALGLVVLLHIASYVHIVAEDAHLKAFAVTALCQMIRNPESDHVCRNPETQVAMLDRLAGTGPAAAAFGNTLTKLRDVRSQLAAVDALGDDDYRQKLQDLVDEVPLSSWTMVRLHPTLAIPQTALILAVSCEDLYAPCCAIDVPDSAQAGLLLSYISYCSSIHQKKGNVCDTSSRQASVITTINHSRTKILIRFKCGCCISRHGCRLWAAVLSGDVRSMVDMHAR